MTFVVMNYPGHQGDRGDGFDGGGQWPRNRAVDLSLKRREMDMDYN